MGGQPDTGGVAGPSQGLRTSSGLDALKACQPQARAPSARRVRDNTDIWSLITGPEAGTWSRLLVQDHLHSDARRALHCTCTAARDMVLVTAKEITISICVDEWDEYGDNEEHEDPLSMTRLHAIRLALQTRGRLRTHLELSLPDPNQLTAALEALEAGTTWLDQLTFGISGGGLLPAAVLAVAPRCCPNLRALIIDSTRAMPSPEAFPKLEELSIDITDDLAVLEDIFRTVAPYLPQLTRLVICTAEWSDPSPVPPPALLPILLIPGSIAARLRVLILPGPLNDMLVGMLLQSAPALEDLTICSIQLKTDMHVQVRCPWRVLKTNTLHLSSLARLPTASPVRILLDACEDQPATLVCDVTGIKQGAAARVQGEWCVWGLALRLRPGDGTNAEDQPAALRAGLSVVHGWPRGNASRTIELCGWTMERGLLLELRHLPQYVVELLFSETLVWLQQPARLYDTLLRLLPGRMQQVYLSRGTHANALNNEQMKSICLGAPANRTHDSQLSISLSGIAQAVLNSIRQEMHQGIYPSVHLSLLG